MEHIEPRDDYGSWELVTEEEVGHPNANNGESLDHAVDDAQTVSGEEVVGEAVPGEALSHSEHEEEEADNPVELARLAESAGEEHTEHVQTNRGDKEQRGPVVDLTHQKAAPDVKGQVERRVIGDRHLNALERQIGAVILHHRHGRVEEEGEERATNQNDDEAVEGNLAQHEGPVVGENLAT